MGNMVEKWLIKKEGKDKHSVRLLKVYTGSYNTIQ